MLGGCILQHCQSVLATDVTKGRSMLFSRVDHAEENDYLSERMRKAFEFLRESDLETLPLGRNEIDGDDVFANVMEYETAPAETKSYEAHRAYYDVHCVVFGEEFVRCVPVEGLTASTEFDVESDFALYDYDGPSTSVLLRAGEICVTAIEDAHKPGCCVAAPAKVRKVVVKVRK